MTRQSASILAALVLTSASASADTIFVSANLTTGANDGTSWDNAFQGEAGLDAALAARTPADVLWVTQGRYRPSVTLSGGRFTYAIDGHVRLYGGFAGGESTLGERPPLGLAETILDGDLLGDDDAATGSKTDNSRHVLSLSVADGRFERVTVEGGYAWGLGSQGGGVISFGGTPSSLDFVGCTFQDNSAQVNGGGVALGVEPGVGVSFFNCRFLDNRVGTWGGGLWIGGNNPVRLDTCDFRRNSAGGGGAVWLTGGATDVTVRDSVFAQNEARTAVGGGAIQAVTASPGVLEIEGCTLWGNRANGDERAGLVIGDRMQLIIRNTILWGNVGAGGTTGPDSQLSFSSGALVPDVSYSVVQGWTQGGLGNLNVDPMLADPMGGDFEPMPGSPAIDSGGPLGPAANLGDFLQKRRRVDDPAVVDTGAGPAPVIDIGAVERSLGAIGTVVCISYQNSTGERGTLDAFGSAVASDNSVVLVSTNLPPNQFGIYIVSRDTGFVPGPTGPPLCLAGEIRRLVGPGQILSSGPAGEFSLALDLTMMPASSGFESVMAGQSWSYQSWHRDVGPSYFYGFTEATTIDFR